MPRALFRSLLLSCMFGASGVSHAAAMKEMGGMHDMSGVRPVTGATKRAVSKTSGRVTRPATTSSLTITPELAHPHGAVALKLRVLDNRGRAVALQAVHEKKAHVIVVSNDLREFDHIHPTGGGNGTRTLEYTPARGGAHTVFVEVTPKGGKEQLQSFPLEVTGRNTAQRIKLDLEAKTLGPTRVSLSVPKLNAGEPATLTFQLTSSASGRPERLGKYLGAAGHAIFISGDRTQFVHEHAMEADMPGMPGMKMSAGAAMPPGQVQFDVTLPRPGLYKVWGQFAARGRTLTAPFVIRAL